MSVLLSIFILKCKQSVLLFRIQTACAALGSLPPTERTWQAARRKLDRRGVSTFGTMAVSPGPLCSLPEKQVTSTPAEGKLTGWAPSQGRTPGRACLRTKTPRRRSQVTSLQLHRSRVPAGVEPGLSVCLAPHSCCRRKKDVGEGLRAGEGRAGFPGGLWHAENSGCCLGTAAVTAGGEYGHREVSFLSRCGPASPDWRRVWRPSVWRQHTCLGPGPRCLVTASADREPPLLLLPLDGCARKPIVCI